MAMARRIQKETQNVLSKPPPGITVKPHPENHRHFDITIIGPDGSPFQGGLFKLELFLTEAYPMEPPKVHFLTKIYHPNVDRVGRICLDILKDKWSPALQIGQVCLSLQLLMQSPNPDDPLDTNIAQVWKADEKKAIATAKDWTRMYAK